MKITVTVTKHQVDLVEPALPVWQVTVSTRDGRWHEAFGSREQLDAFVRGVKAGAFMLSNYDVEIVAP